MSKFNNIKYLFENLFINKYDLTYAKRLSSQTLLVKAERKDEFGIKSNYEFLFFTEKVDLDYIEKFKKNDNVNRLFIGCSGQEGIDFSEEQFLNKLTINIDSGIYLNPDLEKILVALGHNALPEKMLGVPADLLEVYSKECLQFLLGGKGRRYGNERIFESLPDGAILSEVVLLFDGKAYKDGYSPSADDIKRFTSYVEEFNRKYSHFLGKVFSFVIISGHFEVSDESLMQRSRELYESCQTTLSFIDSKRLASLVSMIVNNMGVKNSINWKKIFSHHLPNADLLIEQINAIKKDKIS